MGKLIIDLGVLDKLIKGGEFGREYDEAVKLGLTSMEDWLGKYQKLERENTQLEFPIEE